MKRSRTRASPAWSCAALSASNPCTICLHQPASACSSFQRSFGADCFFGQHNHHVNRQQRCNSPGGFKSLLINSGIDHIFSGGDAYWPRNANNVRTRTKKGRRRTLLFPFGSAVRQAANAVAVSPYLVGRPVNFDFCNSLRLSTARSRNRRSSLRSSSLGAATAPIWTEKVVATSSQ